MQPYQRERAIDPRRAKQPGFLRGGVSPKTAAQCVQSVEQNSERFRTSPHVATLRRPDVVASAVFAYAKEAGASSRG
jgi:hypothetical protein